MKNILTILFLLLCAVALAQVDSSVAQVTDSTAVSISAPDQSWKSVLSLQNLMIVFAGIYEIVIRIYPTAKDLSALSFIYRMINFFIPNVKKAGGRHN